MSNFDEILALDATKQAELIRRNQIKPIELVDAIHNKRIDRFKIKFCRSPDTQCIIIQIEHKIRFCNNRR
jgi:hypothetical protein